MHVMKDEYNIALITGAPNYNTRFIKDHLSNQKIIMLIILNMWIINSNLH